MQEDDFTLVVWKLRHGVFDLGRELGGHHQRVGLVVFGAYLARLIQLYGLYRLFAFDVAHFVSDAR
jgi:hypothetical protein